MNEKLIVLVGSYCQEDRKAFKKMEKSSFRRHKWNVMKHTLSVLL